MSQCVVVLYCTCCLASQHTNRRTAVINTRHLVWTKQLKTSSVDPPKPTGSLKAWGDCEALLLFLKSYSSANQTCIQCEEVEIKVEPDLVGSRQQMATEPEQRQPTLIHLEPQQ